MVDWSKYFTYSDGKLFWAYTAKAGRGRIIHYAGEEATGTDKDGYRVINVSGVGSVRRHRIIWEMHYGEIPEGLVVRHKNDIAGDDRIENLILGTQGDNARDMIYSDKLNINNTSGYRGARYHRGIKRWTASAGDIYLGCFKTKEDAIACRKLWEKGKFVPQELDVRNTSGVTGVFYVPSSGRWRVRVQSGKKRKSYGTYNTLEEAKAVRDKVMKEIEEFKDGE